MTDPLYTDRVDPVPPVAPAQQPAPVYGYSAPQYGQPQPYGYGQPGPVRPTNTLALVSMILSIAGAFLPTAIPGIITGHIALSQIKRTGDNGRGMALAGVIVGYALTGAWLAIGIIYVVVLVVSFGALAAVATTTGSY